MNVGFIIENILHYIIHRDITTFIQYSIKNII